ncbi:hypothetical protein DDQ41_18890 [Streptomyces spongiicola]|uniref:Lipoprotein n=2 Tax=Streptomyces spongiicola TaxID=1690221 RepID=A0ABM6V981_9ACTN|nr:hypothetical protein DDQ41_18890 [Streptomyces spongiicola]
MKTHPGVPALLVSCTLTLLTGCGMTDDHEPDVVTSVERRTSSDVADEAERVSSEIYDLIGIKGKASDTGPGVTDCGRKDPERYFKVFHKWSFVPASGEQLGGVMERLKAELPGRGWKVVEYGPDTSRNENLNLTADNDARKFSVNIVHRAKSAPPKLSLMVVSGCYQVPDGQEVERF